MNNPFDKECPKGTFSPSDFKAIQQGFLIRLSWHQENMKISGFKINRNEGSGAMLEVADVSKSDTTWNDQNITGGIRYGYKLEAYAGENTSNSLTASLTPVFNPTLTTMTVTDITVNSAVSGGNITNDGGAAVSARGICYSTSKNPATINNKTVEGTGTGSFSSQMINLNKATTYYVRAYATNLAGTAYGNEVEFTTKATASIPLLITTTPASVTSNTAMSGGIISSDGGAQVTARGICWSTSENPTIVNSKTFDGSGTGTFTSNLTGLYPGTRYYVRAYATNSVGPGYGNQVDFTTNASLPTLTTVVISLITGTSALSGGNITNDGGDYIISRGVCWSTSTNPTTANSKTDNGTGTGSFVSSITGLSPGVKYYVRAYAINSAGTAYGNELSFNSSPVLPTLTTAIVSDVMVSSATCGGNITNDGGAPVTARGVGWSTTANPTVANSKTTNGTGTGIFISNITGLSPGVTYYVRAYATNSVGTNYGDQQVFTTKANLATLTTNPVTSITSATAVSGGNISSDGGAQVTSRGVCWSTSTNPTTANSKTDNGAGTGSFVSSITGLSPGVKYYVRAYAINSSGTAYGNELSFNSSPVLPTLTTAIVTDVTASSATGGGNVTNDGGAPVTARGVCWSTTANPTIANSKTTNGAGTGTFISNITGLNSGVTYYVRAYATNSAGTNYGNQHVFTTKANVAIITTATVTSVTGTTAVSGGNITGDGGSQVTSRGVCWSITPNPTTADSKTINGSGTGVYTSNITGLNPMTDYYVRAYAINSAGTAYGNQVTFKTTSLLPTLTTKKVTDVTFTTAVSGGNITDDGGSLINSRGVCWSSSPNPTISNSKTNDGTGTGSFTSNIIGLSFGVTYYVRAYATNSAGTGYGNQEEFTTSSVGSVVKAGYTSMTVPDPKGGKWIWGQKVAVGETFSTVLAGNVNNYFIPWCTGNTCCSNVAYNGMSISLHTIITDTNYRLFITGGLSGGAYFTDGFIEIPTGWAIDSVRNVSNTDYSITNNKIQFHAGTSLTTCPCSDCGRANLSFYIRKTK